MIPGRWVSDGHRMQVISTPEGPVLTPICPVSEHGWQGESCRIWVDDDGLLPVWADRTVRCGLDLRMGDDPLDTLAFGSAASLVGLVGLAGLTVVSWQLSPATEGIVWAPRVWVEARQQVAA